MTSILDLFIHDPVANRVRTVTIQYVRNSYSRAVICDMKIQGYGNAALGYLKAEARRIFYWLEETGDLE